MSADEELKELLKKRDSVMLYHEDYLVSAETIEIAGRAVERRHYLFPVEEGVRDVERRVVLFLANNWVVRLQGVEWSEPELSFNDIESSYVHIYHGFEEGFSTSSSSSRDIAQLAKDIQDAQTVLEWAEALYADWQSYFAYML